MVCLRNAVVFLNLIASCDMGRHTLPPRALVASICKWPLPDGRLEAIPAGFFRALWEGCLAAEYHYPKNRNAIADFISRKMLPVVNWFFTTRTHDASALFHWEDLSDESRKLRLGWFFLNMLYRNWKEQERLRCEMETPAPAQWDPLIQSAQVHTFQFVALASSEALFVEGQLMRHCIGTYASLCRKENLRAFSIRNTKDGERVATLTVKRAPRGRIWRVDELFGYNNTLVVKPVKAAVRQFLLMVNGSVHHGKSLPNHAGSSCIVDPASRNALA
jgi:hypothetical protein